MKGVKRCWFCRCNLNRANSTSYKVSKVRGIDFVDCCQKCKCKQNKKKGIPNG